MRKNLIAMSVATLVAGLGMAGGAAAGVLLDNGAATISPSNATQQQVQAGGVGHQLIVPYFNTQLGNATLIQIVNTDGINGKAVKVRFRGASNSDDLYDFQVYLSPNDVWTANVSQDATTGLTRLTTNDNSCTIPAIRGVSANQLFVTARLPQAANGWTDAERAEQTREGYIEIFNMADVPPAPPTATGAAGAGVNPLFTAIKHVASVPPCSGAAIANLQTNPVTTPQAYSMGLRAPTGTLFANWTIINVPKGGAATGEATSLVAQFVRADPLAIGGSVAEYANGNIVFFPQVPVAVDQSVAGAQSVNNFTADPSLRTIPGGATGVTTGTPANTSYTTLGATRTLPIYAAQMFDLPDLSTPYLSNQFLGGVDPVTGAAIPGAASPLAHAESLTRALANVEIVNEFLTATEIAANTDWLFSQPTRRYSVAMDYRGAVKSGATVTTAPVAAYSRFTTRDYYMAEAAGGNTSVSGFQICVRPAPAGVAAFTYWDREENSPAAPPTSFVISPNPAPAPAAVFRMCGETSLLLFNSAAGASVMGGTVALTNLDTASGGIAFRDGWGRMNTTGLRTTDAAGILGLATGNGLPILGKAFIRANAGGVLAAGGQAGFGGSWEHRFRRPVSP